MRIFVLLILFLICNFNFAYTEENYCKDIEGLKAKLQKVIDKVELLKTINNCQESLKNQKEFIILQAKAYILNDNYLFARNLLARFYVDHPDCEIAGYIAYIDFMLGDKEALKESLSLCQDEATHSDELSSRFALINAILEDKTLQGLNSLYPEDYQLYLIYRERHKQLLKFNFKIKGGIGYTTNAFSSNPLDTTIKGNTDSALVDYSFQAGIKRGISDRLSLGVDSELKGIKFFNDNGRLSPDNLSNYTITMTPSVQFSTGKSQTAFKYKFDTMFLNMDTEYESAPIQFFEGHRIELYMNVLNRYAFFSGVGRRYFDEIVRSRWEYDGGIGYFKVLNNRIQLITLFTVRYYNANSKGYDDFGQSLLLKLDYKTLNGFELSQMLGLSFDNFLNSTGYFQDAKIREDKLIRYNLEMQYNIIKYTNLYLSYTFSYRDSLIELFDFNDHRIILGINLSFKDEANKPSIKYQYDFEREYYKSDIEENSLQNLIEVLQEGESIQRGSQCKD